MTRIVIVASLLAVVVAAGAVIVLALGGDRHAARDEQAVSPTGDSPASTAGEGAATAGAPGSNQGVGVRPGHAPATGDAAGHVGDYRNSTAPVVVEPDSAASARRRHDPSPERAGDLAARVSKMPSGVRRTSVERMTPAAQAERDDEQRAQAMYRLPSAYRVQMLKRSPDPQLQVTADQAAQLDAIQEVMLDRSRDALEGVVSEQMALMAELQELSRRRSAIQQELEAAYREQLRNVLTAEQMEVIEGRRKVSPAVDKPIPEP